jgi:phosphodiesterase/alkaline phosphatase D-like protein
MSSSSSRIAFLQIADWGGVQWEPYSCPNQRVTADGMAKVASESDIQFVIALGDNYYNSGIHGDETSHRFADTWDNVYNASSMGNAPWYVCGGNHDWYGNISAQIAYTNMSDRWKFPSLYYKKSFASEDAKVSLDIFFIDTSTYTREEPDRSAYTDDVDDIDEDQHAWLERNLRDSKADYIIVGGHFPVYSVCEHGNNDKLIANLKPLMERYGVQAYMCG